MRAADAELYEKHAEELIRFATMLAGPSAAEDVVASAVLRVFASSSWASVREPRAYLFKSVLLEARQHHRSSQRSQRREDWFVEPDSAPPDGLRAEVIDAMRQLTVRQRAVVYFTYWADLEAGEVASALGLSLRTVQRELTTARRRMEVLLR